MSDDKPENGRSFHSGIAEPVSFLHVLPGAGPVTLADPSHCSITIGAAQGAILTFRPDGRIEAGPAFAADDEYSMQVFDALSRGAPSWMRALRERAERAEAALAAMTAQNKSSASASDEPPPVV